MNALKISHIIYVTGTALFAGLVYAFEQGVIPALKTLTASEYAKMEQGLIRSLDGGATSVIVVATISMLLPIYPLVAKFKERQTPFWIWTFIDWVLFFFGVSLFTIVLNVPINNVVLTWNIEAPPADWMEARDKWNTLNSIRTPINVVSLIAYIIAGFHFPKDAADASTK